MAIFCSMHICFLFSQSLQHVYNTLYWFLQILPFIPTVYTTILCSAPFAMSRHNAKLCSSPAVANIGLQQSSAGRPDTGTRRIATAELYKAPCGVAQLRSCYGRQAGSSSGPLLISWFSLYSNDVNWLTLHWHWLKSLPSPVFVFSVPHSPSLIPPCFLSLEPTYCPRKNV